MFLALYYPLFTHTDFAIRLCPQLISKFSLHTQIFTYMLHLDYVYRVYYTSILLDICEKSSEHKSDYVDHYFLSALTSISGGFLKSNRYLLSKKFILHGVILFYHSVFTRSVYIHNFFLVFFLKFPILLLCCPIFW